MRRPDPDDDERFSVGISLRSKTLAISDFHVAGDSLGSDWDESKLRELPRPLRSGVDGELGVSLHRHLLDDSPQNASANILRATATITDPPVQALLALDPAIELDVHVQQNLPPRGQALPVVISREAIEALMLTVPDPSLDLDQYGADGYRVVESILSPLLRRKIHWPSQRCQLSIHLVDTNGGSHLFRRTIADPYEWDEPVDDLSAEIAAWVKQQDGVAVDHGSAVLEQGLALYRYGGLGLGITGGLLQLLSTYRCDLTLRTHIGPALFFVRAN